MSLTTHRVGHVPDLPVGAIPAQDHTPPETPSSAQAKDRGRWTPLAVVEQIIFDTRYLLVVPYIGLVALLVSFVALSVRQCISGSIGMWRGNEATATIVMLSGLDNVMIANVVFLILAGSYVVYVKDRLNDHTFRKPEDRPPALRHLSPGTLKEKMAASLIGVSSVNLLAVLINVGIGPGHELVDWKTFTIKVGIHLVLLVGLVVFAQVNKHETAASVTGSKDHHG